jgi:Cu/Ag efflux protein CusF
MKTIALSKWTAVCLSALTISAAANAGAGQPAAANKQDKTYTGTVDMVNANDHILKVDGLFFHKDFNLGDGCSYVFLDTGPGAIGGLHAGQKVVVSYRNIDGVRVADLVEQQPMLFEGKVTAIDPKNRTMTVRHEGLGKTFQIAAGCPVGLYNDRSGSLADVQPGNRVTVTYETPYDGTVARRIDQTSQTFTGELTAIDLNAKTVKAKDFMDRKDFNLGSDCTVVLNGKAGANLRDMKLGDRLEFDYTDVNGINIVSRIASVPESDSRVTASSGSPHEYQTPMAPNE